MEGKQIIQVISDTAPECNYPCCLHSPIGTYFYTGETTVHTLSVSHYSHWALKCVLVRPQSLHHRN